MKVYQIVAVKDELSEGFLQPTFIASKEEALRLFKQQVNSIPLWKDNASDFSLYWLGTFDEETGTIIGDLPVKIAGGRSVLKGEEDDLLKTE